MFPDIPEKNSAIAFCISLIFMIALYLQLLTVLSLFHISYLKYQKDGSNLLIYQVKTFSLDLVFAMSFTKRIYS